MDGYLSKPLDSQLLAAAVEHDEPAASIPSSTGEPTATRPAA
jgi:hypothetical protein